jgi:hypothetical protein
MNNNNEFIFVAVVASCSMRKHEERTEEKKSLVMRPDISDDGKTCGARETILVSSQRSQDRMTARSALKHPKTRFAAAGYKL